MDRTFTFTVTPDENGMELLAFLRTKGFSRHILSAMKQDKEAIRLNGTRGFGRTILQEGDQLSVRLLEAASSENILPVPLPLDILYEDEDLMIVNKPADMPIHPSIGNYENTLANAAAYYFSSRGEPFVYRCINRLDRDTTGALILAKNALSAAILSQQMRKRQIRRTYLALAQGITPKKGTICAPIGRVKGSAIEREVNFHTGETAVTHFERLAVSHGLSLIKLNLETGRTHQIRVHMKHLGYPLPGDYLYNPSFERIKRQALHSFRLEFSHPVTGALLQFTAPVPEDFKQAFLMQQTGDFET